MTLYLVFITERVEFGRLFLFGIRPTGLYRGPDREPFDSTGSVDTVVPPTQMFTRPE